MLSGAPIPGGAAQPSLSKSLGLVIDPGEEEGLLPGDSGKGGTSGASQVSLDLIIIKERGENKNNSGNRGEQRQRN